MSANSQAIAAMLKQCFTLLKGDPLLARECAHDLGWDVKQFAVVIDAKQFRAAVDDAVAEALDKRQIDAEAIAKAAAAAVLDGANAKLENIGRQVFTDHVEGRIKKMAKALDEQDESRSKQVRESVGAANMVIEKANNLTTSAAAFQADVQKRLADRIAAAFAVAPPAPTPNP